VKRRERGRKQIEAKEQGRQKKREIGRTREETKDLRKENGLAVTVQVVTANSNIRQKRIGEIAIMRRTGRTG
jgi:hypothetical protein